jgi:hypothetical protein
MQLHRTRHPFSPLRLLTILAVAVFAVPAAAADLDWIGPAGRAQADSPAQLAQACPRIYRPVCAFVRGRWQTLSNSCVARRAGARLIRQGACRANNRQVCCVRGNRRFFTDRRSCRRARGRIAADRYCRVNRRVCCQRGRRNFYTNSRQCRRAGGRVVSDRRCRAPQRTCHQRRTSRRFTHIRGRSWPRACRTAPPRRTCHQRGTSRRFQHIRGRSWPRACSAAGGARPKPKPKQRAGAPCTGKGRHGVTFRGRIFIGPNGIPTCMGDSSGNPRP